MWFFNFVLFFLKRCYFLDANFRLFFFVVDCLIDSPNCYKQSKVFDKEIVDHLRMVVVGCPRELNELFHKCSYCMT